MSSTTSVIEPPPKLGATAKSRRFHTSMPETPGAVAYVRMWVSSSRDWKA
jgi:hypothetical protein